MKTIVVLTGAGISAESGIQTFRGSDGLWEGHEVAEVATPEGFAANPALVQRFYNERRRALLAGIEPNPAHLALAQLEREWTRRGRRFLLVTQNIDDLHERGGSNEVLHMHGELLKARCQSCGQVRSWREDLGPASQCPHCSDSGQLRPHVVWFGEIPLGMEQIESALFAADLFLSIGTSGRVYPAAGFVALARQNGAQTWSVNLDETEQNSSFDEHLTGPASKMVPKIVAKILRSNDEAREEETAL